MSVLEASQIITLVLLLLNISAATCVPRAPEPQQRQSEPSLPLECRTDAEAGEEPCVHKRAEVLVVVERVTVRLEADTGFDHVRRTEQPSLGDRVVPLHWMLWVFCLRHTAVVISIWIWGRGRSCPIIVL